jgi:hypothetical protein
MFNQEIEEIIGDQGWNDHTMLELLINFVDECGYQNKLTSFLKSVQQEEELECGSVLNPEKESKFNPPIVSVSFNIRDVTETFDITDEKAEDFLYKNEKYIVEALSSTGNELINDYAKMEGLKKREGLDD